MAGVDLDRRVRYQRWRATGAARRLLEVASAKLLGGGRGRSGGVATAVADVIGIEPVGIWLRHADDMIRLRKEKEAADACARAMAEALSRTRPALHTDRNLSRQVSMADLDRLSAGLGFQRLEGSVARRIEGLDAWVLPLLLGSPLLPTRSSVGRSVRLTRLTWGALRCRCRDENSHRRRSSAARRLS